MSLSDFKEKYYNEYSQHAVTLNKLNELTAVSSAMEKIVDSYEIALDPKKVENMKINFDVNFDSNSNNWSVITGYCQLGGCNQEGIFYKSEFEARRKAIELTLTEVNLNQLLHVQVILRNTGIVNQKNQLK